MSRVARAFSSNRELSTTTSCTSGTPPAGYTAARPPPCLSSWTSQKLSTPFAGTHACWDYMLDLLQRLGFPQRWRALLTTLFSTASSRFFLNGIPGRYIPHGRGLRQGDPLSPLLFDIAIDPLQRLLEQATESGLLSAMPGNLQGPRVSLYADDATIFLAPTTHDVEGLTSILQSFGEVSGLVTNVSKSSVAPIQCADINLDEVLANFPATTTPFPLKYLGLPISLGRLRRADLQPYIDKAVARLSPWKGKFLNRVGCTALVKSVLSSMPILLLTALKADKGILKAFAKVSESVVACSGPVRRRLAGGNAESIGKRFVAQRILAV